MSCEVMTKVFNEMADKSVKLDELTQKLELSTKSISQAVGNLIKHGYATRSSTGVYRLTDKGKSLKRSGQPLVINPGPEKGYQWPIEKKDNFRSRAWKAIRIKQKFTVNDILMLAKDGSEKQALNQLHIYLRALTRAGFLMELKSREPGYALTSNGFKRYALIKDPGYLAPVFRRRENEVFNPNNGEVLPCLKA